jgi:hypothetical protein
LVAFSPMKASKNKGLRPFGGNPSDEWWRGGGSKVRR